MTQQRMGCTGVERRGGLEGVYSVLFGVRIACRFEGCGGKEIAEASTSGIGEEFGYGRIQNLYLGDGFHAATFLNHYIDVLTGCIREKQAKHKYEQNNRLVLPAVPVSFSRLGVAFHVGEEEGEYRYKNENEKDHDRGEFRHSFFPVLV